MPEASTEIAELLSGYGYGEAKLAQGAKLLAEAEGLANKTVKERGDSLQATDELNAFWDEANRAYTKALKVARVAFGQEVKASAALKLYGPRKQSMAGWLDQARTFYGNLAADKGLSERMRIFGYGETRLSAEKGLVEGVLAKLQAQAQGSGASQGSTVERDQKIAELDQWVSDLRAICKVACAENPQQLEKLGILILNAPRRKKSAVAATK